MDGVGPGDLRTLVRSFPSYWNGILARWRRPFQTKDGYLAVVPYTDAHWRTFFEIAGRPDLLGDPRFKSLESRLANIEILYEELGKIVATRNSAVRRCPSFWPRRGQRTMTRTFTSNKAMAARCAFRMPASTGLCRCWCSRRSCRNQS